MVEGLEDYSIPKNFFAFSIVIFAKVSTPPSDEGGVCKADGGRDIYLSIPKKFFAFSIVIFAKVSGSCPSKRAISSQVCLT